METPFQENKCRSLFLSLLLSKSTEVPMYPYFVDVSSNGDGTIEVRTFPLVDGMYEASKCCHNKQRNL